MSDLEIRPGQVWRRKDPRDNGTLATVHAVDEQFVVVKAARTSRIRVAAFPRNYELVKDVTA